MKYIQLSAAFSILLLSACAHQAMRGTVAMKVSNEEAHVCLGDKEVQSGDKVTLFKNQCTSPKAAGQGGTGSHCEKVKIGEGEVTRTLNAHYSVVQVKPGVLFEEGTLVEKD